MNVAKQDKDVIERMFKAMQTGLAAESEMMALFAADAVFTEPFSGEQRTYHGKDAIRSCFREMWKENHPDVELTVGRVDLDGDEISAEWTCTAPIFAEPMRGVDRFRIKDGLIQQLEIAVTHMPPMDVDGDGEP